MKKFNYKGHAVQVLYDDDGLWGYDAAISTWAPWPATGDYGFATSEEATNAATALIDDDEFWLIQ